jgi:hypothetical protein
MSVSLHRFAQVALVAALALASSAAEAKKKPPPPPIDSLNVACTAALEICLMACEINDQYNNTGGSEGLPLLSFKHDCEQKCFADYDRCMGMAPPTRLNQSRPAFDFSSDGSNGSPAGEGDDEEGGGGPTFNFDQLIFYVPAATFESNGQNIQFR